MHAGSRRQRNKGNEAAVAAVRPSVTLDDALYIQSR